MLSPHRPRIGPGSFKFAPTTLGAGLQAQSGEGDTRGKPAKKGALYLNMNIASRRLETRPWPACHTTAGQ